MMCSLAGVFLRSTPVGGLVELECELASFRFVSVRSDLHLVAVPESDVDVDVRVLLSGDSADRSANWTSSGGAHSDAGGCDSSTLPAVDHVGVTAVDVVPFPAPVDEPIAEGCSTESDCHPRIVGGSGHSGHGLVVAA